MVHRYPHTRPVGGTFEFTFTLQKPQNSGNTNSKRKVVTTSKAKPGTPQSPEKTPRHLSRAAGYWAIGVSKFSKKVLANWPA